MNISQWITRGAARHRDKAALVFDGHPLSYGEMADRIARVAAGLEGRLGLGKGERLAYLGMNRPEALILFFACARIGAIYLPLNWRLAPPEYAYILKDGTPRVLVAEAEFAAAMDGLENVEANLKRVVVGGARDGWLDFGDLALDQGAGETTTPEGRGDAADPVLLCYTSGTTGRPKGAILTQEAIEWNARNSEHMHALTAADRVLTTLPLFHVGGLNIQTTPALRAGATVVLHAGFDAGAALDAILEEDITLTLLVPAQVKAMMAHPLWQDADFSGLRCFSMGSVVVPTAMITAIHDKGAPVTLVYGATETCPIAAYLTAEEALEAIGSTGKCARHCELRIVDDDGSDLAAGQSGEILVRGPSVFSGYWRNPGMSAEVLVDGWYWTGDVGHLDDDGFLYVDDRKKEVIISGGENIYPAMLEQILEGQEGLAEAAVVGRRDARWDEVAVAVVVLKPGVEMSVGDILALFDGRIARFAIPKDVVFADQLPRNAMGKVVRDDLRGLVGREGGSGRP